MRRTCFTLPRVLVALVCLVPVVMAQAPSSIQIFLPNGGMPNHAIRLTLVREDGVQNLVFTDSNGIFLIATPRSQNVHYTVTIESDGQTFGRTVASFNQDRSSPNRTTIFLKPLETEKRTHAVLNAGNIEANIPAKARAAYKRAMDSVGNGQLESAVTGLPQAIRLYPEYVTALNDLGVVFMKLERLDEAAIAFKKATEIDKRFFHPRMNLGMVLNKQEKYREALEILEPLYGENHGMVEIRMAYGQALGGAGNLAEAEKIYRSTLEAKTLSTNTRANIYFRLGVILNREGKFADAVVEFNGALALDPEGANTHVQLGAALMQLQQAGKAERELLRGYALAGSSVGIAQLLLGQIYYAERKFGNAQRAFEQYLKDVPAAPNASQITQLIADLKVSKKN
jgi:Flp pilus assembly protein TadD